MPLEIESEYFCTRTNITSFWGKGRKSHLVVEFLGTVKLIEGREGLEWLILVPKKFQGIGWGFFFSFFMNWNLIFSFGFFKKIPSLLLELSFKFGPLFQVLKSGLEFSWKNPSCWHIWFWSQYMPTTWKFETYFQIEPILGPDFIIDDFDSYMQNNIKNSGIINFYLMKKVLQMIENFSSIKINFFIIEKFQTRLHITHPKLKSRETKKKW